MANELKSNKKTMSSLEIAELAGKPHNDVLKAIRAMEPAWEKVTKGKFSLSEYKDSTGRTLPCYELSYQECMYIASKFNDETRAKLVLRWDALETGKAEPIISQEKTGVNIQRIGFKDQITWVKETKKILNLDNHSTLCMLQKIADPLGLPLPESVDEETELPISGLLKHKGVMNKNGKYMSGQEGNKRLLEAGLIEQVTRHSKSKGKDVPQWVITKKGEKYGKMKQHKDASFPSPVWLLETSDELLSLMNLT